MLTPAVLNNSRLNNFRLGYTPTMAAVRRNTVSILVDGVQVRARVLVDGLTVHDQLNDAPNTATFTMIGETPAPLYRQSVRITIDEDNPVLLFNGWLDAIDHTYEGLPANSVYHCQAIDDLQARANRRLPFGKWDATSATIVALELIDRFGADLVTADHVAADLDQVSVVFDRSEGMAGALTQIARLIGGYFYFEDGDLHLFQGSEAGSTPDPIDAAHCFANDPAITINSDSSQLRTRVYGKGHGESLLADVVAGETILPVANAGAWFNAAGSGALAEEIPLVYTGVDAGGRGAFVGPGVTPSGAPIAAPQAGAGLGTGAYRYAYTWVTASGETLPSPIGGMATGALVAPSSLPTLHDPTFGNGPDPGVHYWGISFMAGSGETLAAISTNNEATYDLDPPAAGIVTNPHGLVSTPAGWAAGQVIRFRFTQSNTAGETTVGAELTNTIEATGSGTFWCPQLQAPPMAGTATSLNCYASRDGGATFHRIAAGLVSYQAFFYTTPHPTLDTFPAPPSTNGARVRSVQLTTIPTGPAGTTARRVYRTAANAAYAYANFKLVATIPDNVTTTFTDTVVDASLGAAAPSSNTTALNQGAISGIAVGPAGTTARKLYRSQVNNTPVYLLATLGDNTTTTYTDTSADGSLGAAAPITDTSGLAQTPGQVNAGSATLLTTGTAGVFRSGGGWASSGSQYIRYAGLSGNSLTGIPPSGPGAIRQSLAYGAPITAAPLLLGLPSSRTPPATATPLTMMARVRPVSLSRQQTILALENPSTLYGFYLRSDFTDGTHVLAQEFDGATNSLSVSAGALTAGTSYHVAGTWNGTTNYVYLDGVQATGAAASGAPAGITEFQRGRILLGTSYINPYNGTILEVAVWTTVLTPTEIASIANGSASPSSVQPGSLVYYAPEGAKDGELTRDLVSGTPINIFVTRNDLEAQAALAAIDDSDGVVEYFVSDERRNEASLVAVCDAHLKLYSRPVITATYATRDIKTKSGKPIAINLTQPAVKTILTIQDVTITEIDLARATPPKFTVNASSIRFTLEEIIRRLTSSAGASL